MMSVLIAVLAAVGLCTLLWLIFGGLLLPVGSDGTLRVYVLATGSAGNVEQILRGLCWLKRTGILGGKINILDAGLNGAGRAQVRYLIEKRYKNVHLLTVRDEGEQIS